MKSAKLLMATALFSVVTPDAFSQAYPSKPIRLIVPFAPAGGPPEQFMTVIRRDVEKWKRVVKEAKITAGN